MFIRPRIIPCLLLKNTGLVKTTGFKNPRYLGDPLNIVRIFNDKEVDELFFLDIRGADTSERPNHKLLSRIAEECFMPLGYGGGVDSLESASRIFSLGFEKVSLNTCAVENPSVISEIANSFGSQSVVVSIDVKKNIFGQYRVHTCSGIRNTGLDPVDLAIEIEKRGAGELLLTSIDRDGGMRGYDIDLIRRVSDAISIPVVACGGAGGVGHLAQAITDGGASAAAAGSMFVYQGKHNAVLISYPTEQEMADAFGQSF